MTNSEKAAYIRGLMEGMDLDPNAKETKLFNAIVDLLDDLSLSVEEMEDAYDELSGQVDEIDEDECYYEVTCPKCGDTIELNEEMLDEGSIDCPNCGETLEFDLEEDDSCDCGENCDCNKE